MINPVVEALETVRTTFLCRKSLQVKSHLRHYVTHRCEKSRKALRPGLVQFMGNVGLNMLNGVCR